MHKSKEKLYSEIKDIKLKEEFDKDINKLKKEYDELLDEDTIALLIVDELGRNKENIVKINNLEPNSESTVFGKVTKINESRNFNRKNGSIGRVVNLELSDETGKCGLALWDKDVELVKRNTIKEGTSLKIINGYIKDGFTGIEINVGRWGLIEIEPEITPNYDKDKVAEKKVMKGKIIKIAPTRAFFKDDGKFGFVTNINLETQEEVKQITVWGEKVKEIQKMKQGDSIEIKYIDVREKNGVNELHINSKGIIKKL
jgi:replication factor A1